MIDKRYVLSGILAVYERTDHKEIFMEAPEDSKSYLDQICYPVEKYLIGYTLRDKERLISAIISNALINRTGRIGRELRKIHVDKSLETIGDCVLDFIIIDNFATKKRYTAKEIDDFRQWYGNNENLQYFAKNCIHLHTYHPSGVRTKEAAEMDQPTTVILADRFEMLIAVIYLEKGIDAVKDFLKKHHFFEALENIAPAIPGRCGQ